MRHEPCNANKAACSECALAHHRVETRCEETFLCVHSIAENNVVDGRTVMLGGKVDLRERSEPFGGKVTSD